MAKKEKQSKATKKPSQFFTNIKKSVVGVSRLAFVSATGVGAYVLWFSTDSLTLHVVSAVLVVRTAIDALKMSQ